MADCRKPVPRVYVVDDERMVTNTLGIILAKQGYDATSFHDPRELIAAVERVEPDLVITDVVMPHINGIDLAIRLKEAHPACKVLLCSGEADTSGLLREAESRGHTFEVFAKPMHPKDLLEQIRRLLLSPAPPDNGTAQLAGL